MWGKGEERKGDVARKKWKFRSKSRVSTAENMSSKLFKYSRTIVASTAVQLASQTRANRRGLSPRHVIAERLEWLSSYASIMLIFRTVCIIVKCGSHVPE